MISRRHFLQFSAATLSTLGLSQLQFQNRVWRYARALASDTHRKRALLVGVNQYAAPSLADRLGVSELRGAVNDVELQRQLLIHRFGFLSEDICVLTDENATRQAILDHYRDRLINGVGPNDVVVFHFSGHGSIVQDEICDETNCVNSTLVPHDYGATTDNGKVADIMGHTRFLLDWQIPTDNTTIVLDCCYAGGGKRGNGVIRARNADNGAPPQIADVEIAFQNSILENDLKWTRDDFIDRYSQRVAKGVVLASASETEKSIDYGFSKFYAGAFTYLLTQFLWQEIQPRSITQVMRNVARSTTHLSDNNQTPEYEAATDNRLNDNTAWLYRTPAMKPPGEAVVTKVLEASNLRRDSSERVLQTVKLSESHT